MKYSIVVLMLVMSLCCGLAWGQGQAPESPKAQGGQVKFLVIQGEIDQLGQGYIIRGQRPAEIFTILNPKPEVLDAYLGAGSDLAVEVRVVSGDNVEILKIGKKTY